MVSKLSIKQINNPQIVKNLKSLTILHSVPVAIYSFVPLFITKYSKESSICFICLWFPYILSCMVLVRFSAYKSTNLLLLSLLDCQVDA